MFPPATFEMMMQFYLADGISRIMPRTNMFSFTQKLEGSSWETNDVA
jgi:hypothetical protein